MYKRIDLNDFPEVSIIDEEGKANKGAKIEVGKRLSIRNPYDFKFVITVESHQNGSVSGEVVNISLNKFENIVKKEIPPLSLSEKVELIHIVFGMSYSQDELNMFWRKLLDGTGDYVDVTAVAKSQKSGDCFVKKIAHTKDEQTMQVLGQLQGVGTYTEFDNPTNSQPFNDNQPFGIFTRIRQKEWGLWVRKRTF